MELYWTGKALKDSHCSHGSTMLIFAQNEGAISLRIKDVFLHQCIRVFPITEPAQIKNLASIFSTVGNADRLYVHG